MNPVDVSLYGILDPARCLERPLEELAVQAAKAGASLLQLRDKHSDIQEQIKTAQKISHALQGMNVPLIINDRVDVALAVGADGVHLGQEDMLVADARRLLGEKAIIGLSVKTLEDAENAPVELLDYAFVGGVFDTQSKDNKVSIGLDGWLERANILKNKSPDLPVGAIAGIDHTNAGTLIETGCDGVAIISGLFMEDDVAAATTRLSEIIKTAFAKRGQA